MMLQHWPTEVMVWCGLTLSVSIADGTAQDSQYPRHAFVVMWNSTQSGMLILRVWPVELHHRMPLTVLLTTLNDLKYVWPFENALFDKLEVHFPYTILCHFIPRYIFGTVRHVRYVQWQEIHGVESEWETNNLKPSHETTSTLKNWNMRTVFWTASYFTTSWASWIQFITSDLLFVRSNLILTKDWLLCLRNLNIFSNLCKENTNAVYFHASLFQVLWPWKTHSVFKIYIYI
jgi:hypothetical protein